MSFKGFEQAKISLIIKFPGKFLSKFRWIKDAVYQKLTIWDMVYAVDWNLLKMTI